MNSSLFQENWGMPAERMNDAKETTVDDHDYDQGSESGRRSMGVRPVDRSRRRGDFLGTQASLAAQCYVI